MVERLVRIQEVRGSIPLISTIQKKRTSIKDVLFLLIRQEREIRGIEATVPAAGG